MTSASTSASTSALLPVSTPIFTSVQSNKSPDHSPSPSPSSTTIHSSEIPPPARSLESSHSTTTNTTTTATLPDNSSHPVAADLITRLNAVTVASSRTPTTTSTPVSANTPSSTASSSSPDLVMGEIAVAAPPIMPTHFLARPILSPGPQPPRSARPTTPRAQTDPPTPSFDSLPTHHPRPRNRSPYSRSHLRSSSGSSSSSLSAPPMTRAHSLPTVMNPSGHLALSPSPVPSARPASPLRSPKRTRSPFRLAEDLYSHSGAPSVCDISEDAELELTPKPPSTTFVHPSPVYSSPLSNVYSPSTPSTALPRAGRRRPASPLHQMAVPFGATLASGPGARTPTSMPPDSPLLAASKFNESFPGFSSNYSSSLASSSMPSTPTSMRSRSPSISSLETIEDIPDAEIEAIEADRIARLQAEADREKNGEDPSRRSSLDVPDRRAIGFGKRDARKRWSVCGAERRGDLDLETIWED